MTDLELVKSKLDIVDVISTYVPNVQHAGSNFRANCPFHNEKTPSFMINPSLQIFKCFGCGKAGDAIKFIQEIERVDFPDALKIAAEKAGVQLTGNFQIKDTKAEEEKKRILKANELTAKFYNYILKTHKFGLPGREYAQKRKLDGQRIDDFLIGFAPKSYSILKNFLNSKGFTDQELIKFGLLVDRKGKPIDKYRNRLMQPIFNVQGDIIGFSGRYIGESKFDPKYLNSPETLVYKKKEILYGLFQAKETMRKENFVVMVEGNIDILSSHRIGVKNIVAPLGTAFTPSQSKLIKRFCENIYFCFDTDSAGTQALIRGIELAEGAGLKHKVVNITGFQDADELICKSSNPEIWLELVKNASDSVEYLIKKFSDNLDLGTAQGKATFRDQIIPVINTIKDEVTLTHYSKKVAMMLDVTPETILKKFNSQENQVHTVEQLPTSKHSSKKDQFELYFLAYIINLLDHSMLKDIPEDIFSNQPYKEIFKIIKSSKQDYDLGEIAESLQESLKSHFEEVVLLDLPQGEKAKEEFQKIYFSIMRSYYLMQLKKLKMDMAKDEDSENLLADLDKTTKAIQKLEKTKGRDLLN